VGKEVGQRNEGTSVAREVSGRTDRGSIFQMRAGHRSWLVDPSVVGGLVIIRIAAG